MYASVHTAASTRVGVGTTISGCASPISTSVGSVVAPPAAAPLNSCVDAAPLFSARHPTQAPLALCSAWECSQHFSSSGIAGAALIFLAFIGSPLALLIRGAPQPISIEHAPGFPAGKIAR